MNINQLGFTEAEQKVFDVQAARWKENLPKEQWQDVENKVAALINSDSINNINKELKN